MHTKAHRARKVRRQQTQQRGRSQKQGQQGGALAFDEVSGLNESGAAANMLKLVGDGATQVANALSANSSSNVIKVMGGGRRTRRTRRLRRKNNKRGGGLIDALSGAIVPLALVGLHHQYAKRRSQRK